VEAERLVQELGVLAYGTGADELDEAPKFSDIYPRRSQAKALVALLEKEWMQRPAGEIINGIHTRDGSRKDLWWLLTLAGVRKTQGETNQVLEDFLRDFHRRREHRAHKFLGVDPGADWGPEKHLVLPEEVIYQWFTDGVHDSEVENSRVQDLEIPVRRKRKRRLSDLVHGSLKPAAAVAAQPPAPAPRRSARKTRRARKEVRDQDSSVEYPPGAGEREGDGEGEEDPEEPEGDE
jgi:hypothetical protein